MTTIDPAFRARVCKASFFRTLSDLLTAYADVRPEKTEVVPPSVTRSSWDWETLTPTSASEPEELPAQVSAPAINTQTLSLEKQFPQRIIWKTMADWEAYRARLVDVSNLQTYFSQQANSKRLSEDARNTANVELKSVTQYQKKVERIKAPEDITDKNDVLKVLDNIAGEIQRKLCDIARACYTGKTFQQTSSADRGFYQNAIWHIETYLNSIAFYKHRIPQGKIETEEDKALFDARETPTTDPARIGRYGNITFNPYQACLGDGTEDDDIYTIPGRCTYWTQK